MRTVAIYPGSFNPWHDGHDSILTKALQCFDHVLVALGYNPEKDVYNIEDRVKQVEGSILENWDNDKVSVVSFTGLLVDFVDKATDYLEDDEEVVVIVRGLRNGHDLQYEMNQQYWNEDLGLTIPIAYFICDRDLAHVSSSMIRALDNFKNTR